MCLLGLDKGVQNHWLKINRIWDTRRCVDSSLLYTKLSSVVSTLPRDFFNTTETQCKCQYTPSTWLCTLKSERHIRMKGCIRWLKINRNIIIKGPNDVNLLTRSKPTFTVILIKGKWLVNGGFSPLKWI